jgi:hypothetical protein
VELGIASESKLEVLKDGWFCSHNYSTILFYFYSNINNSDSEIWVGKDYKPSTGIGIPTHTRACLLEVNTHKGTLEFHE